VRVGDILEWLACAALVYAAYLWSGRSMAALATAACLGYLAQCYSGRVLPVGWVGSAVRAVVARRARRKTPT
jgi:hypothetical protein